MTLLRPFCSGNYHTKLIAFVKNLGSKQYSVRCPACGWMVIVNPTHPKNLGKPAASQSVTMPTQVPLTPVGLIGQRNCSRCGQPSFELFEHHCPTCIIAIANEEENTPS